MPSASGLGVGNGPPGHGRRQVQPSPWWWSWDMSKCPANQSAARSNVVASIRPGRSRLNTTARVYRCLAGCIGTPAQARPVVRRVGARPLWRPCPLRVHREAVLCVTVWVHLTTRPPSPHARTAHAVWPALGLDIPASLGTISSSRRGPARREQDMRQLHLHLTLIQARIRVAPEGIAAVARPLGTGHTERRG